MKKIVFALIFLSGINSSHGMLRRVVRAVTKRKVFNRLNIVGSRAMRYRYHSSIDFLLKDDEPLTIQCIKYDLGRIGVNVDIQYEPKNFSLEDSLKVEKVSDNTVRVYYPHCKECFSRCSDVYINRKNFEIEKNYGIQFLKQCKELGITLDGKTKKQDTLLHLAARDNENILDVYLDSEVLQENINDKNEYGKTALHILVNRRPIYKRLIDDYGAYVNIVDNNGDTPLHSAVRDAMTDTSKYLINTGAYIGIANNDGDTPLHVAARNGAIANIELLVDAGAYKRIENKKGETSYNCLEDYDYTFVISKQKHEEALDLLKSTP